MSNKTRTIGWIIFIFHLVGAFGTIIPQTRDLILQFTPYNLILSIILLVTGHKENWKGLLHFFLISFSVGYTIEVLGVQTGFPFGEYTYGDTLGWKLLGVPIVIGLNWFMLSYIFGMLYTNFKIPDILKVILASLSMVILDRLIEPVAMLIGYWTWEGGNIPLKNYAGWFLISLIIQFCFIKMKFSKTNPLIFPLIVSQIVYFTLVFLFS